MTNATYDVVILVALPAELPRETVPGFTVEYTGVGKVNAAFKAADAIHRHAPKLVINYGTAGSLRGHLKGLLAVTEFYQRDMDARGLGFELGETPFDDVARIALDGEGYSCGTGDNFAQETPLIETDLVDMEAYAIAKVCRHKAVDFRCYKYVSDSADSGAADDWEANVGAGAEAFRAFLPELVKSMPLK